MQVERDLDLFAYPRVDWVHLISPLQRFEGGEDSYDEHIGGANREGSLRSSRGAWQLVRRRATRPVHTMLVIGAGGGTCSLGLDARFRAGDGVPLFGCMVFRR
jgi:hypothetical protein